MLLLDRLSPEADSSNCRARLTGSIPLHQAARRWRRSCADRLQAPGRAVSGWQRAKGYGLRHRTRCGGLALLCTRSLLPPEGQSVQPRQVQPIPAFLHLHSLAVAGAGGGAGGACCLSCLPSQVLSLHQGPGECKTASYVCTVCIVYVLHTVSPTIIIFHLVPPLSSINPSFQSVACRPSFVTARANSWLVCAGRPFCCARPCPGPAQTVIAPSPPATLPKVLSLVSPSVIHTYHYPAFPTLPTAT